MNKKEVEVHNRTGTPLKVTAIRDEEDNRWIVLIDGLGTSKVIEPSRYKIFGVCQEV